MLGQVAAGDGDYRVMAKLKRPREKSSRKPQLPVFNTYRVTAEVTMQWSGAIEADSREMAERVGRSECIANGEMTDFLVTARQLGLK